MTDSAIKVFTLVDIQYRKTSGHNLLSIAFLDLFYLFLFSVRFIALAVVDG